jgi:hypothetical protein
MNMPGFAAEASLYKTSVRYTGGYYGLCQNNTVVCTQARSGLKVQMAAPATRRLRRPRASECPPAMMDGSEMWCLYSSDSEYCTYEPCGYV